jgi:MoxR-like ATPase
LLYLHKLGGSLSNFDNKELEIINKLKSAKEKLIKEIKKVIVGQDDIIDIFLISIFSRGHSLLIGVPGLAKTLLISTLSKAMNLKFSRIQFTPDLMPSDITGTDIIEEDIETLKRKFVFVKGPIFGNIILADEINRTPPKTQAALLQAMQEYVVTSNGKNYQIEKPFFVLATQNPIEQEGTYPLPEAQLDRFMFNIKISYPTYEEELLIAKFSDLYEKEINPILSKEEIIELQNLVSKVPIADNVANYAVKLVRATRPSIDNQLDFVNNYVSFGAGPRASQYLIHAAKARAILLGKNCADKDDINNLLYAILRHRIIINFTGEAEGITQEFIIDEIIKNLKEN